MKIGLRIFLGYFLIVALAALLLARVFVEEVKPGVRQAMEDTLVDTANLLAELATDDFLAGRIDDGSFARRVRALAGRDFGADIWGFDKRGSSYRVYVTDARGIVVFDSTGEALGADYSRWNDVYLTLRGEYGARSTAATPEDPDSTVMHVAAPIRDGQGEIAGVLTVAKPNRAPAEDHALAAIDERLQCAVGLGHRQHAGNRALPVADRRGDMHDGGVRVLGCCRGRARPVLAAQGQVDIVPA